MQYFRTPKNMVLEMAIERLGISDACGRFEGFTDGELAFLIELEELDQARRRQADLLNEWVWDKKAGKSRRLGECSDYIDQQVELLTNCARLRWSMKYKGK